MISNLPVGTRLSVPVMGYYPPPLRNDPKEYQCPLYKTSVRAGILSATASPPTLSSAVGLPYRPLAPTRLGCCEDVACCCARRTTDEIILLRKTTLA